jgi:phenylalanine-4-hydroxylase
MHLYYTIGRTAFPLQHHFFVVHTGIVMPNQSYTPQDHETWERLWTRMHPQWIRHATPRFLEGLDALCLPTHRVPRLEDVNQFLQPRTGFRAKPVDGYMPAFRFFDALRNREFPTTVTIRHPDQLDYLPEPDIFHDLAGHVPMHTHPRFADTLVRFGACAHTAGRIAAQFPDPAGRAAQLTGMIRAMARFFWFTVEFGLMRDGAKLKVYGSGLLSSHGEIQHALESLNVERRPIRIDEVIQQPFQIDRYQPLLYVVESFEHLYFLVGELESRMLQGALDDVAPGEPEVLAIDVDSFPATTDATGTRTPSWLN